jgi:hypothetical protein
MLDGDVLPPFLVQDDDATVGIDRSPHAVIV